METSIPKGNSQTLSEQNVTINIGRIEVRAVRPTSSLFTSSIKTNPRQILSSSSSSSTLSLKDYLKLRDQGRL